jgi:hypothetical protein
MSCGSVLASEAWCKNYACSLNFPRCGSFKDAPLPICRQTCVDCFRTCTPGTLSYIESTVCAGDPFGLTVMCANADRPILPPGIYYQPDGTERTWEKQYTRTQYDAWSKAYICEADNKLVDGGRFCKCLSAHALLCPCAGACVSARYGVYYGYNNFA